MADRAVTYDAAAYNRDYQRRVAGRGGGDLAEVRAHLAMLAEAGVTLQTIAAHTGLSYPGLHNLRSKATRVSKRVADTVLAVDPSIAPDNANVPIERMETVLAQLEAAGWTRAQIGRRLGVAHGPQTQGRKYVRLGRVRACAALLDEPAPDGPSERERLETEAQRDWWRDRQNRSRLERGLPVAALTDTYDPALWRDRASCSGRGLTKVFVSSDRVDRARARRICDRCPVRPECLDWVLGEREADDFYGICGGTDETERSELRRQRRKVSA